MTTFNSAEESDGTVLGQSDESLVGFHGNKAAQVTSVKTEIMAVIRDFFTSMTSKGLYNQSGVLGGTMILSDGDGSGDGDLQLGVGDDWNGIVRSDGYLDFIIDGYDQGDTEFRWREGAGETQIMKLEQSGDLTVEGYLGIKDGISTPSTDAGTAIIYVDSSGGDLKIKFGDGTVKTIVTDS